MSIRYGDVVERETIILHGITWRHIGCVALLALFLLLLSADNSLRPQPVASGETVESFTAYLDAAMPQRLEQYGVPGASMALIRQGEVAWTGAYGYADLAQKRPMTVDAVCRAESISKSVTAWGVMKLAAAGRIALDDPVQLYLEDVEAPLADEMSADITVRRLLSNSAGFALGTIGPPVEYAPQSPMPTVEAYLQQEIDLVQAPGAGFLYSNVGFNLLELVVEEASGQDFAAYMAADVLEPLGMDRASFAWQPAAHSSMPMGYELDGAPAPPYVYPVHAAGGLLANVEDIARFVSAGAMTPTSTGNAVLAPQSRSQLYTPVVPIPGLFSVVADSYGFGHFVETLPNGRQAVWHGGQGHGWMTHFHLVPETGDGIVILSNSQRSWPLIAQTLQDWAVWSGNGAVKFSHITTATMVLQAIVVVLGAIALWLAARLGQGLRRGTRRLAPLAAGGRYRRLLQFLVGVGVIAALTWSISRPYRDFTSIFPTTAVWADATFLILALLLILSATLPPTHDGKDKIGN